MLSPSVFLNPGIEADMGTLFGARRLQALVPYGEGPHITSMTLLPLALIALRAALIKRTPLRILLAAITVASVVLTNWFGAFALAVAIFSYMLVSLDKHWRRMSFSAAGIGLLSYVIASPWIPPSSIAIMRRNSQQFLGDYPMGVRQLIYAIILLAIVTAAWLLIRKLGGSGLLQFAAVFLIFMGGITFSIKWFGAHAVPQPERYHLEMEMALCLVIVFSIGAVCHRLKSKHKTVLFAICCALLLFQAGNYRDFARRIIQPMDITSTVEHQVA